MEPPQDESSSLLNDDQRKTYMAELNTGGVRPSVMLDRSRASHSHAQLASAAKQPAELRYSTSQKKMPAKSFSVSANGDVSYLTPAEMGKHELYENLPMTAVFGLQKKEKSMSMAFASFAADLDVMEQEANGKGLSAVDKENIRSHASLLLLDEIQMDSSVVTSPLIFAVLVATFVQFIVGYNIGVMNAPSKVVFPGHSTTTWTIAVSAFAIGGPIGSNFAGPLADKRGRRGALLLDIWTFLLGGCLQTFAGDMFTIILARFIIGMASGGATVLVPIYLGELAPPTLRGMLGTMTQFGLVIGILASDFMAFPFATVEGWRVLFGATPFICIVQLILSPFLLESPRWLLGRDKNSRKARYIIKRLRALRYDHEVETEAGHYISATNAQNSTDGGNQHQVTITDIVYDKKVRILLVSALVLQMAQQLCGINAVFYYSTMFFEGVIDDPLVGTTIVGAVNVLATYVALLLMDSCGRRTLILWSSGGMFVCCVILMLSLLGVFPQTVSLLAVNLYVSFFEIGLGPIPWLIVAEMFDAKYVAVAMSACSQLNWLCNFVVGMTFPYLVKYLNQYSFLPFAMVLLFTFVFALIWLPETQGTTPEELQEALVKKNSCTVYHNMDIESTYNNPIDLEWKLAMDQLMAEEEKAMKKGSYNYGFQPIQQEVPTQPVDAGGTWLG